jgi:putative Mg2+ transporter-C (MgtC) family protein
VIVDPTIVDLWGRFLVAIVLGTALGWERDRHSKNAGLRTHALVSGGAALFTLAGAALADGDGDPTRVAAQVVTGIGFIGAGAIVRSGLSVVGVTTAATLWMAAAVGTAAGFGRVDVATAATLTVLCTMWFLAKFRSSRFYARQPVRVLLTYRIGFGTLAPVFEGIEASGGSVSVDGIDQESDRRHVALLIAGLPPSEISVALDSIERPEIIRVTIEGGPTFKP